MRVAYFSPMPPAGSGIADYSATLVEHLGKLDTLEIFPGPRAFLPSAFDAVLYQIGNNADHAVPYETALQHPGVIVLHEANLHHLIATLTIKRNNWDGYLRECEYDGGAGALAFAQRVRALEVGPDYDGVPMLRRVLNRARGLIAHSSYVIARAREAGYTGPAARIPHGAWIPEVDRMEYRRRLGLGEFDRLIGVFGHLKPYKRIAESLRAFSRVVRREPNAKLLLVGEPHPELPLDSLIAANRLGASVRVVGRASIDDFVGYLAASDIVLNLRYPTVGETSGSLLRALGLGRAVIVSDVGAFSDFPDEVCLKVPVGGAEEDLLTEYLGLLVERVDLARAMGERARAWVAREADWPRAAAMYHSFLEAVVAGREWSEPPDAAPVVVPAPAPVERAYVESWARDPESEAYVATHITRLQKTLELTPPGGDQDRALEMGAYLQITPSLKTRLGYGEVRGCYYGQAGHSDHKLAVSKSGERFECDVDLFDAEKDPFPYPDSYFTTVLCCELIEHLPSDPMHMMAELNRIVKDGGWLLASTPNIGSLRAISAILNGYHPGFFPAYLRPNEGGGDARHNREYTPKEMYLLFHNAGFTVEKLETGPFRDEAHPEFLWVEDILDRYGMPKDLRGDGIYILGRKTGPVRERYPAWLYA